VSERFIGAQVPVHARMLAGMIVPDATRETPKPGRDEHHFIV
jgi:hypothetical protein